MPPRKIPQPVEEALHRVLDYLWLDEAADCLETSPLEGRNEHIFHSLVLLKKWLEEAAMVPQD